MSHVATIDIEVKSIADAKAACARLGLEFRENQQTYRWYGTHVGDYPLPAGFKAADLGRCQHAIGVKDNAVAYEIGVCARRDGKPGYTLLWDFYCGGHGLEAVVGKDCVNLRREYAAVAAIRTAQAQGFRVQEHRQQDGSIKLLCTK